jgi:hypothetical protein
MQMLCEPLPFDRVRRCVLELADKMDQLSPNELKGLLKHAVPEYQPQIKPINDSVHRKEELRVNGETHLESAAKDRRNGHPPGASPKFDRPCHQVTDLHTVG